MTGLNSKLQIAKANLLNHDNSIKIIRYAYQLTYPLDLKPLPNIQENQKILFLPK